MDSVELIVWLIIFCTVAIVFLIFSKPLKVAAKIGLNSVLGCLGLMVGNMVLAPMGIQIGINVFTALVVGVLGLPGFISLYIMQAIL